MNEIFEYPDGFLIPGIAFVTKGHGKRAKRQAREIAERIARDPKAYLDAINLVRMDTVRDLRGLGLRFMTYVG